MTKQKIKNTSTMLLKITVFVAALFAAIFLSIFSVQAQSVRDFSTPSFACKYFSGQPGFSIIRNLEHECLVRNGSGQTYLNTRFYDSGSNFCMEVTSPMGQIVAPQCIPISETGREQQQKKDDPDKIITPPSFQIRELQYDTLPTGKPIQTSNGERVEIKLPDGSLIQLDANATFTPVSDKETQSVFGRFRYMWQPFHDGQCIVGQNLVRQACRKVTTKNAVIGNRDTEYLIQTDNASTTVWVLEGTAGVADLAGKKTVEVAAGQYTIVKKGGLPSDPKTFDPAQIDRWWEKEEPSDSYSTFFVIIFIIIIFLVFISIIAAIFKKRKPKISPAVVPEPKTDSKNLYCTECGAHNSPGAKFCGSCGKPIGIAPVNAVPEKEQNKPASRSKWITVLIVVIVAITIIIIFITASH